MASDDKFSQKHVRLASINVHPSENSLVIHYKLEGHLVSYLGNTLLEEKREMMKVIQVGPYEKQDIKPLAKKILEKCSFISASKQHEVEELLLLLWRRRNNINDNYPDYNGCDCESQTFGRNASSHNKSTDISSVVDDCIELLYDSIPQKIRATSKILQLAQKCENVKFFSQNEVLLTLMSRVLREDGKTSRKLSLNIVSFFFCFARYRQMQHIVSQYKIGSLCMELVENEISIYQLLCKKISNKRATLEKQSSNANILEECKLALEKYTSIIKMQDEFLLVAFGLLLTSAENPKVEKKMVKFGIVTLLANCLDRENTELLSVIFRFMGTLSTYLDNKKEFFQNNVVKKFCHLISLENEEILGLALHLLWNLSFDSNIKKEIEECDLIPKLIHLLSEKEYQNIIVGILNQVSMECTEEIMGRSFSGCVPFVMQLMFEFPIRVIPPCLTSLGINLAKNKNNALLMCNDDGLNVLLIKALYTKNFLLLKLVRTLSKHDEIKHKFLVGVDILCAAIVNHAESDVILVEYLKILKNLSGQQIDFADLFYQYDLLGFMEKKFEDDCIEDIARELIAILGATAVVEDCALMIYKSEVMKYVISYLQSKQENDKIVLQILNLFYQLIQHLSTREFIIKNTQNLQILVYVADLMQDKNPEVRKYCDLCLTIISGNSEEWAARLEQERRRFNKNLWLQMTLSHLQKSSIPSTLNVNAALYTQAQLEEEELCLLLGIDPWETLSDSVSSIELEALPDCMSEENLSLSPESTDNQRAIEE